MSLSIGFYEGGSVCFIEMKQVVILQFIDYFTQKAFAPGYNM